MDFETTREIVEYLRECSDEDKERLCDELEAGEVSPGITALDALLYDWEAWGRPEQQLPGDDVVWRFLALRAGRGGGKTRAGSEMTIQRAAQPELCGGKIALIAPTHGDIRITMVEGESGVLACSAPWFMPTWEPGYGHGGRLRWPGVGPAAGHSTAAGASVEALCFSAEKPKRLRGPQFGFAWGDEYAAWAKGMEVFDLLNPALRLGKAPQAVFTSTPKPTPFVERLDADARKEEAEVAAGTRPENKRNTIQRVWSTFKNARNLPSSTVEELQRRYGGTTQGEQELEAGLLTGDPRAMWQQPLIDRWTCAPEDVPEIMFAVVAVDNAVEGKGEELQLVNPDIVARNKAGAGADTGIIPALLGVDGIIYIFADWTIDAGPEAWAQKTLDGFANVWQGRRADEVVIERNGGGELIERNLAALMSHKKIPRHVVPTRYVRARDGKETRAEPVLTLYELGRVRHVRWPMTAPGAITPLADLEFQMTRFRRGKTGYKKDRVDALVYAITRCAERMSRPDAGHGVAARWGAY